MYSKNLIESKWIQCIELNLNTLGLGFVWLNQGCNINKSWLKHIVSQTLSDQYKQEWYSIVFESHKCINYRMFKTELCFESYFKNLPFNLRKVYIKFRCRNVSKLPVEAGCYLNIQFDERICTKCNLNVIGDEFHYVLICPFFENERKQFLKKFFYNHPSTIKFNDLFNSKDKVLLNLCKFISVITKNL